MWYVGFMWISHWCRILFLTICLLLSSFMQLTTPIHYFMQGRELTMSGVARAEDGNGTRPGDAPREITILFRRAGRKSYVPLIVDTELSVALLLKYIKEKMASLSNVADAFITLQLEVVAGDGADGVGTADGCAALTKLFPLSKNATVVDALKSALGREVTVHDSLSIVVDVAGPPMAGSIPIDPAVGTHKDSWEDVAERFQEHARLAVSGSMPFDPALGIDKDLWNVMSLDTQKYALLAVSVRRKLAAVPMLRDMRAKMTVEQAKRNHVSVLQVVGDDVKLGVFDVPAVISGFMIAPNGTIEWDAFVQ